MKGEIPKRDLNLKWTGALLTRLEVLVGFVNKATDTAGERKTFVEALGNVRGSFLV